MIGSDFFPSRYLKAEEIAELCPLTVTIKTVVAETLKSRDKGNSDESKPVVYFEEIEKGVILNKTNWYTIAGMHGDDSDTWQGKQIALVVVDVDAFGDVVSAIRVKKPAIKSAKKIIAYHPVKAGQDEERKEITWPAEVIKWACDEWDIKSYAIVGALKQSEILEPDMPVETIKHWLSVRKTERDNGVESTEATERADADYLATHAASR